MSGSEFMVKNIFRFPFLENYQNFDFLDIFLTITSETLIQIKNYASFIILKDKFHHKTWKNDDVLNNKKVWALLSQNLREI